MAVILPNSTFYHIPKTGGTFVTRALGKFVEGSQFVNLKDAKHPMNLTGQHITPKHLSSYNSFTFVRNPLSWYKSQWAFKCQNGWHSTTLVDEYCKDNEFKGFLEKVLEFFPLGWVSMIYKNFVGEDLKDINFIGKQENLIPDLLSSLRVFREDFNEEGIRRLEPINVTAALDEWKKRCKYTLPLAKKIAKCESWAMDKFDYDLIK